MSNQSMMGKIFSSLIKRPLRNFNVDNRAERIIESQTIRPAPRHRPDLFKKEVVARETKEQWTELLDRLKSIKIISHDPIKEQMKKDNSKLLPQNKSYVDSPEFGVFDVKSVPRGKISLRQVVEFLNHHHANPNLWNAELIAKEYKLDLTMTEQILRYFSLYNIAFPDKEKKFNKVMSLEKFQKYLPKKSSQKTTDVIKS